MTALLQWEYSEYNFIDMLWQLWDITSDIFTDVCCVRILLGTLSCYRSDEEVSDMRPGLIHPPEASSLTLLDILSIGIAYQCGRTCLAGQKY